MAANGLTVLEDGSNERRSPSSDGGNFKLSKLQLKKKLIDQLMQKIPKLLEIFDLHKIIGEGSYGSVYLASLKVDADLEDDQKKFFAIKHLIPISHPDRIEHELNCLRNIGGQDNVVGVDLCLRHNDAVVFVMPYLSHTKFVEYFLLMDMLETKLYIKNLLLAVKRVHEHNVIHRDIKPSNFLYDRVNRRYLLVDFGLAQKIFYNSSVNRSVTNNNDNKKDSINQINDKKSPMKKRKFDEMKENDDTKDDPAMKSRKLSTNKSFKCNNAQDSSAQYKFTKPMERPLKNGKFNSQNHLRRKRGNLSSVQNSEELVCPCKGAPTVCKICLGRLPYKASRSGTPGFRPPEVLLKYPDQTTAVDIWACGIILLCILSGCYPFFKASDDITALAEIITLFGYTRVQHVARELGRDLICSFKGKPVDLKAFCLYMRCGKNGSTSDESNMADATPENGNVSNYRKLQHINDGGSSICDDCALRAADCICLNVEGPACFDPERTSTGHWVGSCNDAFDLLDKLLDLNPRTRIKAVEALQHPFLTNL